jgi:hypothetical protein
LLYALNSKLRNEDNPKPYPERRKYFIGDYYKCIVFEMMLRQYYRILFGQNKHFFDDLAKPIFYERWSLEMKNYLKQCPPCIVL